jgi:hypothetical protein
MGVEAARRDLEDIAPPLSAAADEPGEEADPYTLDRGQGRFKREPESTPTQTTGGER